ncbi:hypothetical protein B5X24_HaOG200718 [Helicoverpa armigera]|uniref:Gustatory receptor n=1 Tax=Helicoverpa armigera TaxID=29058 RepID=A0A2W1BQ12_HELAM|nr:hypothetical protein B5X24_HaOG200718 [Helicoverpa armigera]
MAEKHYVDKDVQSMLLPLNLMQTIALYPKYSIWNNVITPNSAISNVLSLCATMAATIVHIYEVFELCYDADVVFKYIVSSIQYFASFFDIFLTCIGFNFYYFICIFHSKNNVSFVLKFQKVHRFLTDSKRKRFIFWNWITMASLIIFDVAVLIYIHVKLHFPLYNLFCCLMSISFDVSMNYALRLMKLLSDKIEVWNMEAQNLRLLHHSNSDMHCQNMFKAYVQILECYNLFKCSFQQIVCITDVFFCIF